VFSGMWRLVGLVITDVLVERVASGFSMERIRESGRWHSSVIAVKTSDPTDAINFGNLALRRMYSSYLDRGTIL
jgi:hypothetical protein